MPTAAKLFAAVAFALVAYVAAELFKPAMDDGTQFGFFSYICAVIGAICGWRTAGGLAGDGYGRALGNGFRTSFSIVFWVLLGFSIYEMILLSMKLRYDGPMEAIVAVFGIVLDYARRMLRPDVLGVLIGGGLLGGLLAEWASKRWR